MADQTFTQTKFLGATLAGFRVIAGWNEQASKIDIYLYEDTSDPNNPDDFILKEGNVENSNGAMIGTPVLFQCGDFSFAGLLEITDEEDSFSKYPGYTVTLTSPIKVLDGAQVIMSSYIGPTNDSIFHGAQQPGLSFNVSNLINIYGWMEDGGDKFGRSQLNETGLPWNGVYGVKNAIETITSSVPVANQVPDAYKNFGCYLYYRNHFYKLDLSNLPVPPDYYYIGGGVISWNLLELISQFCQDAGVDYIVKLTLGQGNGPHTISFQTVNRVIQPTLGQLAPYIRSSIGVDLMSADHGYELRSDITQAMLVGGNVNTLSPLYNTSPTSPTILPFWGFDVNGNPIIGSRPDGTFYADDDHAMNLNAANIADLMGAIGLGPSYPCTILELRCAMTNYDTWAMYIMKYKSELAAKLNLGGCVDPNPFASMPPDRFTEELLMIDLLNDSTGFAGSLSNMFDSNYWSAVAQRLYEFVREQANIYYGKKFLVRLPFQVQLAVNNTGNVLVNYDIADAGFLPEGSQPLGLNYINENFLLDQSGRFYPFVRFQYYNQFNAVSGPRTVSLNQTNLSFSSIVQYNTSTVYSRCEQGTDFPTLQNGALTGGSPIIFVNLGTGVSLPAMIISINEPLFCQAEDICGNIGDLAYIMGIDGTVLLNALYTKNTSFPLQIHPPAVYPDAACVAIKSNQFVYGPWGKFAANGKIEFDQDESLVPWEYGGYDILNQAALAKIQNIAMGNQVLERSTTTKAGLPIKNLGDVLVAGGPVITSIQVTVDPQQGVQTQYTMETFVNRVGAFTRENADRVKRIGKLYQKLRRSIRQLAIENNVRYSIDVLNYSGFMNGASYSLQQKSPHGVLGGNLVYDSTLDVFIPQIFTQTHQESVANVRSDNADVYLRSACVGLEGLFRPFTLDENNLLLPLYARPSGNYNFPPHKITGTELNPFQPSSDFTWILSGDSYNGLNYKKRGDAAININEVRPLALRGPLVIQGWGYDIAGNPVPNSGAAIDLSSYGIPGISGYVPYLYDKLDNYNSSFFPNYLQKSIHWPTAALDYRWDKFRGVWASPGYMITGSVTGIAISPGGSGYINIYIGDKPTGEQLYVENFMKGSNASISPSTRVICGYDPLKNVWRPMVVDCP